MSIRPEDRAAVVAFVRDRAMAVVATTSAEGSPEAALVGVAALDDGTLILNSRETARKMANLARDGRVALVVGLAPTVTVQIEGTAVVVTGAERERLGTAYNEQRPGSRSLEDGFAVIAVRPHWVRVYDVAGPGAAPVEARWE